MKWFTQREEKRAPKTTIQTIQESSIDSLINGCTYEYKWNIDETKEVLKKCETPLHFVRLYYNAFRTTNTRYCKMIDKEALNSIYLETCKSIASFIKNNSFATQSKMEEIKKMHSYLNCPWLDMKNSPERIFLQKRLEAEWKKLSRKEYDFLQEKGAGINEYEKLFFICNPSDDIVLEIAEKINSLC